MARFFIYNNGRSVFNVDHITRIRVFEINGVTYRRVSMSNGDTYDIDAAEYQRLLDFIVRVDDGK